MTSGTFDRLTSIEPAIAKKGNEAEEFLGKPEYCLLALRGWLEELLLYLERRHSIRDEVPAEARQGEGENNFRINRLRDRGVISEDVAEELHHVRRDSNKAAHSSKHKLFLTQRNAERALLRAMSVSDWLYSNYGPTRSSATSTVGGSPFGRRESDIANSSGVTARPVATSPSTANSSDRPPPIVAPPAQPPSRNESPSGQPSLVRWSIAIGGIIIAALYFLGSNPSQTPSQATAPGAQQSGKNDQQERQRQEAQREREEQARKEDAARRAAEQQRIADQKRRAAEEQARREAAERARREQYLDRIRCANFNYRGQVCCPRGQRPNEVYTPRPAGQEQYTIMCVRAE